MPSRFGVWSVGRLLLLAAALGGTFLLFFGVALRVALRAREVQVPPLVGKTAPDASQSLGALGLTLKIDPTRRTDPNIALNRIMQQDPPAGAAARSQRSIRVWLSAGPRTTTLPELVGQTERTARIPPQQDGVEVGSVLGFPSAHHPPAALLPPGPPPPA